MSLLNIYADGEPKIFKESDLESESGVDVLEFPGVGVGVGVGLLWFLGVGVGAGVDIWKIEGVGVGVGVGLFVSDSATLFKTLHMYNYILFKCKKKGARPTFQSKNK